MQEVGEELQSFWPCVSFEPLWVETHGDKHKEVSLRGLEKTDFFTRELDLLLLERTVRVAVHSAKDLPDPLPAGLCVAALTQGLDARDALVLRGQPGVVATSSQRRELAVLKLYPEARFVDVRGTIEERLKLLERGEVDGVVVAEAALLRLGMTHLSREYLPGETAEGQGQLAVVCRMEDEEMRTLFRCIDVRRKKRGLYVGLNPSRYVYTGELVHHPVIRTVPIHALPKIGSFTHILFTSPMSVNHWFSLSPPPLSNAVILAIGSGTAATLREYGHSSLVAPFSTQEGMIALLETLPLLDAQVLWPRSMHARPLLLEYLNKRGVTCVAVDLYRTETNMSLERLDLTLFDEVIFTSPSTVRAWRQLYGSVPCGVKITSFGPETSNAIAKSV